MSEYRREFQQALVRIEQHARIQFRDIRCSQRKDDCISETVGLAWVWWTRLRQKGQDPRQFVSALASFAVRAVRSGRRVCGSERSKDVLSPVAQRKHQFSVSHLPASLTENTLAEALADSTSDVVDQVHFRLDFPAWVSLLSSRDQSIIADMLQSERTSALADKYGLSPARISQLRKKYEEDWTSFVS
jgi:hypothetical protein